MPRARGIFEIFALGGFFVRGWSWVGYCRRRLLDDEGWLLGADGRRGRVLGQLRVQFF